MRVVDDVRNQNPDVMARMNDVVNWNCDVMVGSNDVINRNTDVRNRISDVMRAVNDVRNQNPDVMVRMNDVVNGNCDANKVAIPFLLESINDIIGVFIQNLIGSPIQHFVNLLIMLFA